MGKSPPPAPAVVPGWPVAERLRTRAGGNQLEHLGLGERPTQPGFVDSAPRSSSRSGQGTPRYVHRPACRHQTGAALPGPARARSRGRDCPAGSRAGPADREGSRRVRSSASSCTWRCRRAISGEPTASSGPRSGWRWRASSRPSRSCPPGRIGAGRSSTNCWRQFGRANPSRTSSGIPATRSLQAGDSPSPLGPGGHPSDLLPVTHQRGVKPFSGEALLIDGQLFSRLLSEELRDLPLPPRGGPEEEKLAYEAGFN